MPPQIRIGKNATMIISALVVGASVFPLPLWLLYPRGKATETISAASLGEIRLALAVSVATFAFTLWRLWKRRDVARIPWHQSEERLQQG